MTWLVSGPVVVRSAETSAAGMADLGCHETARLAGVLARDASTRRVEAAAIADELHMVIGRLPDDLLRPELVGLRRSVVNQRAPDGREWNSRTRSRLTTGLIERIEEFLAACSASAEARRSLADALERDIGTCATRLARTMSGSSFRRAVLHADPVLSGTLERWLRDGRPPRAGKLRRLVRYFSRAATKTSPYSSFMLAGFAADDQPRRTVVEVDEGFFGAVVDALGSGRLVRINPSCVETDGVIEFLGRPPGEPIVQLRQTPAVAGCLGVVRDGPQSPASLAAELVPRLGVPPKQASRLVDRLLEIGLLQAYVPVPDLATDRWQALIRSLEPTDVLTALLADLRAELRRRVPLSDIAGERAHQDRLRAVAGAVADKVGLDGGHEKPFYETTVGGKRAAPSFDAVADDLGEALRWMVAFDWKMPIRAAAGAFFRECFGPGRSVSYLRFHRAVQECLAAPAHVRVGPAARDMCALFGPGSLAGLFALERCANARLRELASWRCDTRTRMLRDVSPDGVVRLTRARIAESVARRPGWIADPLAVACYVQVVGPARVVLNAAHDGHGRNRTRLAHLFGEAGLRVPGGAIDAAAGADVVMAELAGTLGSTLNRREPAAPYEIDYPFTVSDRPADRRLPLGELSVRHNPATDLVELWSASVGRRVVPLHLGMRTDVALPPAARLLQYGFGVDVTVHQGAPPLSPIDVSPADAQIRRRPRVDVGRVTVQRARWDIPTVAVPVRRSSESDADWLLRLTGWRLEHDLPTRSFVRTPQIWRGDVLPVLGKPIFVDFDSWHLIDVFTREIGGKPVVAMEEALPCPADGHVEEFLVEIRRSDD
ncbi:lantibiotic dehydratase [Virgisporangium aurantiacum]|uniref:Lantibiotic dehydratase N-terminal domain-containing protein n=1 Tax=Virgisporangium aurantiacum TaxID=175570 RepID=A0A8J3ZH73_9ACTN|nr:lantibiotic dehydratase [Virgisporangium aurantiacum]GIJ63824.1 hypothetical protein Vau01_113400 [Virgisporangium aurantiacum]